MKILVTGAEGFIGSYICRELEENGHIITKIDKNTLDVVEDTNRRLDFFMKQQDMVIHAAGLADNRYSSEELEQQYKDNVTATHKTLNSMTRCGVKRLILLSSAVVYGDYSRPIKEIDDTKPISIYGSTKLMAEELAKSYAGIFGMKNLILRLNCIVGDGHIHGVTYDFFNKLLDNPRKLTILGDGHQTKTFLHIEDLFNIIESTFSIFPANGYYEVYNVGNIDTIKITRLAEVIIEEMRRYELVNDDVKIEYTGGKSGWNGDSPVSILDKSKLFDKIKYKMKYNTEEAIRDTIRWLYENHKLFRSDIN
jgi:UDP-glucose 4-epimerase